MAGACSGSDEGISAQSEIGGPLTGEKMGLFDSATVHLRNLLGNTPLDRDTLLDRITQGILKLKRHGARGKEEFPLGVVVTIQVADGSLDTLARFVREEKFEQDLNNKLSNQLVNPGDFPTRRYQLIKVEGVNNILVEEDPNAVVAVLKILDGDCANQTFSLDANQKEWRIGRGKVHSDAAGRPILNDIILTESDKMVSRAAAILRRNGSSLELVARDQGEYLNVVRANNTVVRPARTASSCVPVRPGDRLEFFNEKGQRITLAVLPASDAG